MSFDTEMAKARKRVASLDRQDGYKERSLGTIASALEAGLRHPDNGAQYDALVMLGDLPGVPPVRKLREVS